MYPIIPMARLRSVLHLKGALSNGVSQMELSITYDKYCSIFIQIWLNLVSIQANITCEVSQIDLFI